MKAKLGSTLLEVAKENDIDVEGKYYTCAFKTTGQVSVVVPPPPHRIHVRTRALRFITLGLT